MDKISACLYVPVGSIEDYKAADVWKYFTCVWPSPAEEEQFQLRKSIIRLSKAGKKIKEIAEVLDVSERHVNSIRSKYKKEGFAGISLKQRGRRVGEQRLLTAEQEKKIRSIIVDKTPEQLKLRCCMLKTSGAFSKNIRHGPQVIVKMGIKK